MLEFEKEVLNLAFAKKKELEISRNAIEKEMSIVDAIISDVHKAETMLASPISMSRVDPRDLILQTVERNPGLKVGEIARLITASGTPIESKDVSIHIYKMKSKGLVKEKGWRYWMPKEEVKVSSIESPRLIKKDSPLHTSQVPRF